MFNVQKMNLDLIRTFIVLIQSGNIKEASRKLDLDASNVSRHINSLEKMYKTSLIVKNKNGYITLTDNGKILYDGFEKGFNLFMLAEKEFLQSQSVHIGKISIGVENNINLSKLLTAIHEFKKEYPDIAVKIIKLSKKELQEKLKQYYLDFIIIDQSIEQKGIQNDKVDEEKLYLQVNSNVTLKDKNTLKEMISYPAIVPVNDCKERQLFEECIKKQHLNLNLNVETCSYQDTVNLLKESQSVALLPENFLLKNNSNTLLLPIKKETYISYYHNVLSDIAKKLIDLIETQKN